MLKFTRHENKEHLAQKQMASQMRVVISEKFEKTVKTTFQIPKVIGLSYCIIQFRSVLWAVLSAMKIQRPLNRELSRIDMVDQCDLRGWNGRVANEDRRRSFRTAGRKNIPPNFHERGERLRDPAN